MSAVVQLAGTTDRGDPYMHGKCENLDRRNERLVAMVVQFPNRRVIAVETRAQLE
jgi:hypothetical protein